MVSLGHNGLKTMPAKWCYCCVFGDFPNVYLSINGSYNQRDSMRGIIWIGHHGNRRWRQIQIQVYDAERPLACRTAMDRPPYNAVRPVCTQTIIHGHCYVVIRLRVNNGIKTLWHTNFFRHCYVHNFYCICAILQMEILILKFVLFSECAIHTIWLLGPDIQRFVYVFKSILFFVTHGLINFRIT